MKLGPHHVEKPWGRIEIPAVFGCTNGKRVGEVWFDDAGGRGLPLLAKYIFTSEKLSIQVHPNDAEAQERGLAHGKSECWYILDAEPTATLGLGLTKRLLPDELRNAALDGSIEDLMDWHPVAPGDFYFVPAGTVHAIGAGVSLLEFQQNADVTYRLYDYGRPRELHLDDGIEVSRPDPYPEDCVRKAGEPIDTVLHEGPEFTLVRASTSRAIPSSLINRRRWVMPIEGWIRTSHDRACAGECLLLEPNESLELESNSIALIGCQGRI